MVYVFLVFLTTEVFVDEDVVWPVAGASTLVDSSLPDSSLESWSLSFKSFVFSNSAMNHVNVPHSNSANTNRLIMWIDLVKNEKTVSSVTNNAKVTCVANTSVGVAPGVKIDCQSSSMNPIILSIAFKMVVGPGNNQKSEQVKMWTSLSKRALPRCVWFAKLRKKDKAHTRALSVILRWWREEEQRENINKTAIGFCPFIDISPRQLCTHTDVWLIAMGKFAPKEPVDLDPPRDDPFTKEELLQYDGMLSEDHYMFRQRGDRDKEVLYSNIFLFIWWRGDKTTEIHWHKRCDIWRYEECCCLRPRNKV